MKIARHGSAEPLSTNEGHGNRPTCYAYLRGREPSPDEVLAVRGQMVEFCESNQLYLARIFHDLDVEPTNLDYPSLREVVKCVAQPDTRSLLLADLEFVREPSAVLRAITTTLSANFPAVRVRCFVPEEAFESLGTWDHADELSRLTGCCWPNCSASARSYPATCCATGVSRRTPNW